MNFKKRVNGSWTDTPHYIHKTDTDTITTLPAVLYPTGTTATIGLKGQAVQSTTPTHDNPIMPQGTGERTGNLWDKGVPVYAYGTDYKKYNSNNAIALKAGTYTISSDGILPQIQAFHADLSPYADIRDVIQKDANMYVGWDNRALLPAANTLRRTTIVIAEDCIITLCCNPTYIGTYIMLNVGNTPLPYEPYGYKIPISSASTTTPVYLGEVQSTRKIKKLALTGEESYVKDGNATYLYYVYVSHMYHTNCLCSHLKSTTGYPTTQEGCSTYNNAAIIYLNFGSTVMDAQTSGNTVAGLKEYLAAQYANGTPVTIWYVLSSATTGTVNEPLMKIGSYADEVSNISIPVTAGGDTLSVGTTVQPSKVTVNYKGWHPAIVHEKSKNLVDIEAILKATNTTYTKDGDTFTIVNNNTLASYNYYFSDTDITASISGIITNLSGTNARVRLLARDGTQVVQNAIGGPNSVTKTENKLCAGINISYGTLGTFTLEDFMLNAGSSALPYEPYWT